MPLPVPLTGALFAEASDPMTPPTDEAGREFPRTSLTLHQRIHARSSADSAEALNEFFSAGYEAIAARLGTSPDAVKQRMRTFRARFHQCLRRVVGEFVQESDIDEEIAFLMSTLRGE